VVSGIADGPDFVRVWFWCKKISAGDGVGGDVCTSFVDYFLGEVVNGGAEIDYSWFVTFGFVWLFGEVSVL